MNHIFQTTDEQYAKLEAYAAQHGQTPETLFQEWIKTITRDTEKLPSVSSGKAMDQKDQSQGRREEELLNSPLFQVAGVFAIGEQGWADRHDEYLAETYLDDHAEED